MVLNNAVKLSESRRKWTIPNNAVNQSDQEHKKGIEIAKKLTQRAKQLSKLILVTKLMYNRAKTVV